MKKHNYVAVIKKNTKLKLKISWQKSKRNQQTEIAAVSFGLDSISETVNSDPSCPTVNPLGTTPAKKKSPDVV